MNYKNAEIIMDKKKDTFGRGWTFRVFVTDGENDETLYHGGNDLKAYEVYSIATNKLEKLNVNK